MRMDTSMVHLATLRLAISAIFLFVMFHHTDVSNHISQYVRFIIYDSEFQTQHYLNNIRFYFYVIWHIISASEDFSEIEPR